MPSRKRNINTLEDMALNILPEHLTESDAAEESDISVMINIWERQKTNSERTNQIHTANAEVRPGTPPGAPPPREGYAARCECGTGREANRYNRHADKWICQECAETLRDGRDGGFAESDEEGEKPPAPGAQGRYLHQRSRQRTTHIRGGP